MPEPAISSGLNSMCQAAVVARHALTVEKAFPCQSGRAGITKSPTGPCKGVCPTQLNLVKAKYFEW